MKPNQYRTLIVLLLCIASASLLMFVMSIPSRMQVLETFCQTPRVCEETHQLSKELAGKFKESGIPVPFYVGFRIVLESLVSLGFMTVGGLVLYKRPQNVMAIYTFIFLVLIGTSLPLGALASEGYFWEWPVRFHQTFAWILFVPFFYLFPNGKFVPKWTVYATIIWLATELPYQLFPNSMLSSRTWPSWMGMVLFLGFLISCMATQIYRYKKVSNHIEKLQTKWFVLGFIGFLFGIFIGGTNSFVPEGTSAEFASVYFLVTQTIESVTMLFIPFSIAYAILRYKLWSIDFILSRTILYSALTVTVIGLHVLVVGGLGALFKAQGNIVISLLATGFIALLFQPLTLYFQKAVNRLIYGERDEPFSILVRLGQRMEGILPIAEILPTLLETIVTALKLPYAEVILNNEVTYSHGDKVEDFLDFPLTHQGDEIGRLRVGQRSPNDPFTRKDRNLIGHLSRQVGVAAHSVLLHSELQASRRKIVSTREEERKRLRRDLHDGIGPSLAAQTIKVGVARQLLYERPESADQLLETLESDLAQTLTDIRHIIYNLRPPSLDDLGLIGAVNEYIAQVKAPEVNEPSICQFNFHYPDRSLPSLSAAVQVAAYRIIQEAITNVIRHSQATDCNIYISEEHAGIGITITDNGSGIHTPLKKGVGLLSMQERASELGGSCKVFSAKTGGTTVEVYLPY